MSTIQDNDKSEYAFVSITSYCQIILHLISHYQFGYTANNHHYQFDHQEPQKMQHLGTEQQNQQLQQQDKHQEQHRLTPISCLQELQELRDLYRKDWPEHCVGYFALDNFLRWLQKQPEMKNLHIYTLNGDWRSNGLFLIVDRYQLFVGTLCTKSYSSDWNELLTKAIFLLNWTPGYKVSSFLERHRSAVLNVVSELNLQKEYDSLTVVYYMPAATAAELPVNCRNGYEVRPMSITDAAFVDELWPNRHQGSLFLIQRLIAWNINMGVYVEHTNELVAWCLRLQGGFLGALQVKDTHKRLGLGSLVTCAISRRIARELGHDITACVNRDNVPSCSVFNKLGFKQSDTAYWLRTFPTEKGLDWPEGV